MKKILASGWLGTWLLVGVGLGGCEQQQKQAPAAKGPPEVEVSLPVAKKIHDYEDFSGRLEANAAILIRARVTGYLLENPDTDSTKHTRRHYFKEGGRVQKGDVLFKIDPQLYEAELALAEGSVAEAQGQYDQAKADWFRVQKLHVPNEISSEELNKFRGNFAIADGRLKAAKANLKKARVNMAYTTVVAPISGTISKAMIDPGNLVKADDTALTSIGASDPIKAYFDVDERTLTRILRLMREGVIPKDPTGVPVEMGLADDEERPYKGHIDFTDNSVDFSTGTLRVRGSFDNPYDQLVPGMFVRVRLPIGEPQDAILIAEKALVTDQGQKFVYVVKDENDAAHEGKVEYRPVKLGRLQDGLRVVKEGLAPGEKVVVTGLQRVRPDIKVKFKDVPMPLSVAGADATDPTKPKSVIRNPQSAIRNPQQKSSQHEKGSGRGTKGH